MSRRRTISEAQLRKIVQQELFYREILGEGLWDDVKVGAKKLINSVTKQVTGSGLIDKAKEVMGSLTSMPDEVKQVIAALKHGMKETGESIKLDGPLKAAKEIGELNTQKMGALLAADLKGPVHDKAAKLQNEWNSKHVDSILNEVSVGLSEELYKNRSLNEGGVLGMLGLSLAGFGGIMFLLKGIEKLANYLGAERIAKVVHKVHHTLHHVEEKTIDFLVPDVLSYAVYKFMRARGFKAQAKLNRVLTREEYSANTGGAKMKVEKLIYAAFLIFLAWEGIKAALHAGVSLLGFAEGTASVIKGAEITQAAAHISDIIELGIEEFDDFVDDVDDVEGEEGKKPSKN